MVPEDPGWPQPGKCCAALSQVSMALAPCILARHPRTPHVKISNSKTWLTLEGEPKFDYLQLCGDFPLNHNKQKCKMFPNNHHEESKVRERGMTTGAGTAKHRKYNMVCSKENTPCTSQMVKGRQTMPRVWVRTRPQHHLSSSTSSRGTPFCSQTMSALREDARPSCATCQKH